MISCVEPTLAPMKERPQEGKANPTTHAISFGKRGGNDGFENFDILVEAFWSLELNHTEETFRDIELHQQQSAIS